VAALLPFIFRAMKPTLGVVVAAIALTGIPSLNAKLVLGVGAPWFNVLLLNAVYAAVAMLVYLAITGDLTQRRRR
jgi:phosphoribosylcarboxyaminoimidazole (NCAIR) mutase